MCLCLFVLCLLFAYVLCIRCSVSCIGDVCACVDVMCRWCLCVAWLFVFDCLCYCNVWCVFVLFCLVCCLLCVLIFHVFFVPVFA